jgi:hypothetical protein
MNFTNNCRFDITSTHFVPSVHFVTFPRTLLNTAHDPSKMMPKIVPAFLSVIPFVLLSPSNLFASFHFPSIFFVQPTVGRLPLSYEQCVVLPTALQELLGYYLYTPTALLPRRELPILNLYIRFSEIFHMMYIRNSSRA